MNNRKKYIVALELAGTRVNGVLASLPAQDTDHHATPLIEAIVSEAETEGVQYGRVQNLINATRATTAVIREMAKQPEIADDEISGCYAALAGLTMGSDKVTAQIELATEMEINADILRKLFEEAAQRGKYSKRVLQVLPRKFYVDGQAVTDPIGTTGRRLKGDFTLVNCDVKNQRQLERVFNDKMHMNVYGYVEAPLALADMTLGEEEKQIGCILVDFGATTTTVVIYKDRALQYLAVLPMGSKYITRDIHVGMNMLHDKAEAAKIEHGDAIWSENASADEVSRIKSYVSARAFEIMANIKANIDYAGYKTTDLPAGFILAGRGARLTNFDKLIADRIGLPVRMAKLPDSLNFAFSFGTVHPEDYMSIIAVALRAAHRPGLKDCVAPVAAAATADIPLTIDDSVAKKPAAEKADEFVHEPADIYEDDDNWKKDDPIDDPRDSRAIVIDSKKEHKSAPKDSTKDDKPKAAKPKGGRTFLKNMQDKIVKIFNDPEIGDNSLDD